MDPDLESYMLDHLGVEGPTKKLAGGVEFSVGDRGASIILGVSRPFTLVDLTPGEARDLAANLIAAARRSERYTPR